MRSHPELVDRLPHVLDGAVLARVGGQPEPAEARDLVGAAEQPRRVAALGAGDVEADDAGALVQVLGLGERLAREDLRDVRPVLAHRDHDQAELHRRVARGCAWFMPESAARIDWRGVRPA